MREIRMLRATWRGLETWPGQDALALPARQSSTLPMRGVWKRSHGQATKAPPDERGGQPICSTYSHRATLLLYALRPFMGPVWKGSKGEGFRTSRSDVRSGAKCQMNC